MPANKKREYIFRNELYLWYVAKDSDMLDECLHILSKNQDLHLSYYVNQKSSNPASQQAAVLKSKSLQVGLYPFYPPLTDRFTSEAAVCAILSWYYSLNPDNTKLLTTIPHTPFDCIDFKQGVVSYINNDFSTLQEDMLQVVFPNNFMLDVGWYGSSNGFIIHIINNENWEEPFLKTHESSTSLRDATINAIELIEEQIKKESNTSLTS